MIPCSWAASSASATCLASVNASAQGNRPARQALRQLFAIDELHHHREHVAGLFETMNVRDVRVIQDSERPGLALEPNEAVRIVREQIRQHFDRNVAIEPCCIACPIHLAHAASANCGDDLVGTQTRARN
jgi:hypothetical protein